MHERKHNTLQRVTKEKLNNSHKEGKESAVRKRPDDEFGINKIKTPFLHYMDEHANKTKLETVNVKPKQHIFPLFFILLILKWKTSLNWKLEKIATYRTYMFY